MSHAEVPPLGVWVVIGREKGGGRRKRRQKKQHETHRLKTLSVNSESLIISNPNLTKYQYQTMTHMQSMQELWLQYRFASGFCACGATGHLVCEIAKTARNAIWHSRIQEPSRSST